MKSLSVSSQSLPSAVGPCRWADMSQEAAAEGSSTEDPVLSLHNSCGPFQEDMEETSSVVGLAPGLPGESSGAPVWVGSRKRVLREEAHQNASSQVVGAPGTSLEAEVVLGLQAMGESQDSVPGPRLHIQPPTVPAHGRAQASKRLQVTMHDILAGSWPRNLCSASVGTRKKSRRSEAPSEEEEGADGFLWLGQSPGGDKPQSVGDSPQGADLESLGGPCSPLSCKDTGCGPGDPGGSWMSYASGVEKFEYLPTAEGGTQPGSPCDPVRSPLPSGGESLQPAARDSPQSPVLCLGVSGKASTEQKEARHIVGPGGGDGPATSHNQEELEVKAQPVSGEMPGQGLAAALQPVASKASSGPSMGRRRSKCAKQLSRGPVPHAQDQGTDRCPDDSNQDQAEESSPGGCPKLVG